MHKYTDRVICDGCGKNLRGEDYGTIFFTEKSSSYHIQSLPHNGLRFL